MSWRHVYAPIYDYNNSGVQTCIIGHSYNSLVTVLSACTCVCPINRRSFWSAVVHVWEGVSIYIPFTIKKSLCASLGCDDVDPDPVPLTASP